MLCRLILLDHAIAVHEKSCLIKLSRGDILNVILITFSIFSDYKVILTCFIEGLIFRLSVCEWLDLST